MALPRGVRTAIFWTHLVVAVTTGLVVLVLCVTGVLLAYEPQVAQLVEWWGRERHAVENGAPRLPPSALVAAAAAAVEPGTPVRSVAVSADPAAPATLVFPPPSERRTTTVVHVDPFSARVVDTRVQAERERRARIEGVFKSLRGWHGRLGRTDPETRSVARLITGGSTAAVIFLVVSGLFLWWPRRWTAATLRPIAVPAWGRSGKARDFNWHNALGLWAAPVVFLLALTGVYASLMELEWGKPLARAMTRPLVIWAGDPSDSAAATDTVASAKVEARPRRRGNHRPVAIPPGTLDTLWARAERAAPAGWDRLELRFPTVRDSTAVATVSYATGRTLELELASDGAIARRYETAHAVKAGGFDAYRLMMDMHTGVIGGIAGQTLALLASAVGAILVWTGLALALRRLAAWRKRRARTAPSGEVSTRCTVMPLATAAVLVVAAAGGAVAFGAFRGEARGPDGPAGDVAADDVLILHRLVMTAMSAVETGQLAATQAARDEVKTFAHTLVGDYTEVVQAAVALSARLGVDERVSRDAALAGRVEAQGTRIAESVAPVIAQLTGVAWGPAFDSAYVAGQVAWHEATLRILQDAEPRASHPELEALIASMRGRVQRHRDRSRAIQAGTTTAAPR